MEYLKPTKRPTATKAAYIKAMTTKRAAAEREKSAAYLRISQDREPICAGCKGVPCDHSHRLPVDYADYAYIGVDDNIDLFCRECHLKYENGYVWMLDNGEEVMDWLSRTEPDFFIRKLYKMGDRLKAYSAKNWLALSQGTLKIPEWAEGLSQTIKNR